MITGLPQGEGSPIGPAPAELGAGSVGRTDTLQQIEGARRDVKELNPGY